METIFAFNTTLAVLTIIGMVMVIKLITALIFNKKLKEKSSLCRWLLKKNFWMIIGFALAFLAVLGTLIYSEAIGFPPCRLCWFQRIFMYPILVLLGAGIYWKDVIIARYVQLLAFAGAIVAIYHYVIQMSGTISEACGTTGVQCAERLVFEFGFVTIPLMSLTIFILIFVLMFFKGK